MDFLIKLFIFNLEIALNCSELCSETGIFWLAQQFLKYCFDHTVRDYCKVKVLCALKFSKTFSCRILNYDFCPPKHAVWNPRIAAVHFVPVGSWVNNMNREQTLKGDSGPKIGFLIFSSCLLPAGFQ